jgi:hypothetical protein
MSFPIACVPNSSLFTKHMTEASDHILNIIYVCMCVPIILVVSSLSVCLSGVYYGGIIAIPKQAVGTHKVMRQQGSHILYEIRSEMVVSLSALRDIRALPPDTFLVLVPGRGCVELEAISNSRKSSDKNESRTFFK